MFLLAGIFVHWGWLLLAALFALTARGEVIKITYQKGIYQIPLSHHELPELVEDVLSARRLYL